ncbi:hypothetical protein L9F63_014796, partial [Diploptera punctata]
LPGDWYCHFVYPKHVAGSITCWSINKNKNSDGTIDFSYSYHNSRTNRRHSGGGKIHQQNNISNYKIHHGGQDYYAGEYHLLATDKEQFILFGGCPKAWAGISKVSWIDFRDKKPSKSAVDAAAEAVKKLGLDISDYETVCTDHTLYN